MTTYTPEQQALHRSWWIEGLRSGYYNQGKGCLCEVTTAYGGGDERKTFCCLGVGMEVAIQHGGLPYRWNGFGYENIKDRREYVDLLPPEVADFYGIETIDGAIVVGSTDATTLVAANDELEWDFETIAILLIEEKVALVNHD